MTCHDMTELLAGCSAGELNPAQREFVELHLRECPPCRAALADLELTRRQLEDLRAADRWQPALTGRIMQQISTRPRPAWGWLRFAGGLAAVVAAAFLIVGRWPTSPAGPPPGVSAHVVAGDQFLQVDAGTSEMHPVAQGLQPDTQLAVSGGSRYLLSGDQLLVADPSGAGTRPLARASGIFLGAAPDGRTVWLARNLKPDGFVLESVDTATGQLTADPNPDIGRVSGGFVSRDGRTLYLVGTTPDGTYLKLVDTVTRTRTGAYRLAGFSPAATALAGPGEQVIYVVDHGLLAVAQPAPVTTLPEVFPVAGLSPVAALRPDGALLVCARPGGGLVATDPATRRVLRRTTGPAYSHLSWSENSRWLYAITDSTLAVLDGERLTTIKRIPLPAGAVSGLSAR